MTNIGLLNCYFGSFPWYFKFFLKSCENNNSIEFIIFSDAVWKHSLPGNVKIIPFTLQEFNLLATLKLQFKVEIREAYKLCDFKPAYGIIFEDYIRDFSFWGICDIDLIFGRIREFITEEKLKEYELISVRNDYPTGSFMIFKNNLKINRLFMKSKDYRMIFTSQKHFCFDECNFKHEYLQNGGDIFAINCEIESMHHVIKREEFDNKLKVHFDFLIIEGLPGQLKWDNGVLSYKNEYEVLMYHLILFKSNLYTHKFYVERIPDIFYIDKYLIRFNNIRTFNGKISKVKYNIIFPFMKMLYFKIDAKISQKLNFPLSGIPHQKIQQTDYYLEIDKRDNLNSISFNGKESIKLIKSFFYSQNFYIDNFGKVRYSFRGPNNQLVQLNIKGNVQHFN